MHPRHEALLTSLLSQPTAPFREVHVTRWVTEVLDQHGAPYFIDPIGPAPEFVHVDDVEGQRKLCVALMREKLPWGDPWRKVQARLKQNYREYLEQL